MRNFEEIAKHALQQGKAPVDTDRIWNQIDQTLRPDRKRNYLLPWLSAVALAVGVWQLGTAFVQPVPTSSQKENNPLSIDNHNSIQESKQIQTNNSINQPITKTNAPINQSGKMNQNVKPIPAIDAANYTIDHFEISNSQSFNIVENTAPTFNRNTNVLSNLMGLNIMSIPQLNKMNFTIHQAAIPKTKECFEWKQRPGFYVGAYVGGGYPIKNLNAKKTEVQGLLQSRKGTESQLESWEAGGFFGVKLRHGIRFETGLEYQRLNEKFELNTTRFDTVGKIITTGFIIKAPGDTMWIQELKDVVEETKTSKKVFNNHTYFHIPIAIGYDFPSKQNYHFYAKVGALINVSVSNKVTMYNELGKPVTYDSRNVGTDFPFKSNIGLTPFLSGGCRIPLMNKLDATGEVQVKWIHDISRTDYAIGQSYLAPSLRIGVQWDLN